MGGDDDCYWELFMSHAHSLILFHKHTFDGLGNFAVFWGFVCLF
jgi:hypothetical protein